MRTLRRGKKRRVAKQTNSPLCFTVVSNLQVGKLCNAGRTVRPGSMAMAP